MAAKITGKVQQVFIDEGVHVTVGQILAKLDDSDYQVSLASAKADREAIAASIADLEVQLGNATREANANQRLTDAGIQTILEAFGCVADPRGPIECAESPRPRHGSGPPTKQKLPSKMQNIENCQVRSPYTGIVVTKDAQPGEMVSPISAGGGFTRTGIATIVDMASNESRSRCQRETASRASNPASTS